MRRRNGERRTQSRREQKKRGAAEQGNSDMKNMSLEALIADIPNRPIPVAIFCSPAIAGQLAAECQIAGDAASEDVLSRVLGMRIYFDPTMPPTAFEVGYSQEEVSKRLRLMKERERAAAEAQPH